MWWIFLQSFSFKIPLIAYECWFLIFFPQIHVAFWLPWQQTKFKGLDKNDTIWKRSTDSVGPDLYNICDWIMLVILYSDNKSLGINKQ